MTSIEEMERENRYLRTVVEIQNKRISTQLAIEGRLRNQLDDYWEQLDGFRDDILTYFAPPMPDAPGWQAAAITADRLEAQYKSFDHLWARHERQDVEHVVAALRDIAAKGGSRWKTS